MGILSPFYDASFDGVDFWEQDGSGGGYRPGRPRSRAGGTVHVGSTNTNIQQDMGQAASEFDIIAACEGAEYDSLIGKAGTSASLVWSRGTETVYCKEVVDSPGKAGALDAYTIVLKMVKL